jgi:hypothetical protein
MGLRQSVKCGLPIPAVKVVPPKASAGDGKGTEQDGSSVATSLAAGLAALVLVCFGIQRVDVLNQRDATSVKRPQMMNKLFRNVALREEKSNKYEVVLALLDKPLKAHVNFDVELGKDKDIEAVSLFVEECKLYISLS